MNVSISRAISARCLLLIVILCHLVAPDDLIGCRADWPMLGRDSTRNSVSPGSNPPITWRLGSYDARTRNWNTESSPNLKWVAQLGSMTFGDPVVANGLVWVGTNNNSGTIFETDVPDASVLACFRESDGKLLYAYVSPRLPQGRAYDWPTSSIANSPLIEDDRLWFVTNRHETVCLDIGPLIDGEGEPRVVWKLDMIGDLNVVPSGSPMAITRSCSIAGYEERLFVVTGNGTHPPDDVPAPHAPSLICIHKDSGEVLWEDNSPQDNILYGQWSSPLVAEAAGRVQVIVAQGDGWVRSFDPVDGRLIWECDMNPKTSSWDQGGGDRCSLLATPVLYQDLVYVSVGRHPILDGGPGRLSCLDPSRSGDISAELAIDENGNRLPARRNQAVIRAEGEEAIPNPNSGIIWEFTSADCNRDGLIDAWLETMHRSCSSVSIKNDLLISADSSGIVHCLNAQSGEHYWSHDLFSECFAAPLIVEDKVYICDEYGNISIFRLSPNPSVAMKDGGPINDVEAMSSTSPIYTSPIYANDTLYIANRSHLFAISSPEETPVSSDSSHDWPQWRGANRDNKSTETGLLNSWPEDGPPLEWQVNGLGQGIASVSIAEGRIYTTTYSGEIEFVVCLDERSGQLEWATPVGEAVRESSLMRWLSQRTPTVDGDRIYSVSAKGELCCLSTDTGEILWRKDYVEDFGGLRGWWGFCDFPVIDGDRLICMPGGLTATIVALNKFNGEIAWQCPIQIDPEEGRSAGYASALIADIQGVRQYINFLHGALVGVSVESGELLWRYERFHYEQSAVTPIVMGDQLFCVGAHRNYGIARITLNRSGEEWSVVENYFVDTALNHFQDNMILFDDHVVASDRRGLICASVADGTIVWRAPEVRIRNRFVATTFADGHVYVRGANDDIFLIEASPTDYRELARFTLPEPSGSQGATSPVVVNGRLLIRDDDRMFCFDIRNESPRDPDTPPEVISLELPTDAVRVVDGDRMPAIGPRSVFVPTPHDVVEKMLESVDLKASDVVVDLGSGDGRILIAAAESYGCRTIGYEIDEELVELSRARATDAQVADLVTIHKMDLFRADLADADVVTVYLLPDQLEQLKPQLQSLKPGARIVSHQFKIPGIEPDETIEVESADDAGEHAIYIWIAPLDPSK